MHNISPFTVNFLHIILYSLGLQGGNCHKNCILFFVLLSVHFSLSYKQEAVDWLSQQPFVEAGGIGVVGVSTGGMLALLIASLYPEKVGILLECMYFTEILMLSQ